MKAQRTETEIFASPARNTHLSKQREKVHPDAIPIFLLNDN